MDPLPRSFYARPTLDVARELVGCRLIKRERGGALTAGVIVETEGYLADDPACHAYRGPTDRNAVMFGPPGIAYVYFIYGMYHCLNAVTEADGVAGAVLIRAVEPTDGLDRMRRRRKRKRAIELCSGPGKLCQAFKLDRSDDGRDLAGPRLWIAARPDDVPAPALVATTRVGLKVAVDRPWRYYEHANPHVSRPR